MEAAALSLRQKTSATKQFLEVSDDSDSDSSNSCVEVARSTSPPNIAAPFATRDREEEGDDGEPVSFDPRRSHTFHDADPSPQSKFNIRRRRLEQKFSRNLPAGVATSQEDDDNEDKADTEDDQEDSDDLDDFIDDGDNYYDGYEPSSPNQEAEEGTASTSKRPLHIASHKEDPDEDAPTRWRRLLSPPVRADEDDNRKIFRDQIRKIEVPEDIWKLYPASLQNSDDRSASITTNEATALGRLILRQDIRNPDELYLDQFTIYENIQLEGKGTGGQLLSLFTAITAIRKTYHMCVDGTLQTQGRLNYQPVNGLHITGVTIGALIDPSLPSTKGHVFLKTTGGQERRIQYRLKDPAPGYQSVWENFMWLADFTKYTFHYLLAEAQKPRRVSLKDFSDSFWVLISHYYTGPDALVIQDWHRMCGRTTDFRKHVIRYASFLQIKLLDLKMTDPEAFTDLVEHDLWDEIGIKLAVKKPTKQSHIEKTVVTPEVGSAFLQIFPSWGSGPNKHDLFDVLDLSPEVAQARDHRRQLLHFPDKNLNNSTAPRGNFLMVDGELFSRAELTLQEAVRNEEEERPVFHAQQVLDTIIIVDRGRQSQYAYVKDLGKEPEQVKVVWLVLPSATICGSVKGSSFYPIGNELFFVDECNCQPVRLGDILGSYQVDSFASQSSSPDGFFVNALYRHEFDTIVTPDPFEVLSGCIQHSRKGATEIHNLPPPGEVSKLIVQSLYSGCGLLDHSMSSTEYINTTSAIDINEAAILSHKANTKNTHCRHIHGSTNALLRNMCIGTEPYHDVDCTVAGCPCKGFTKLNARKTALSAHRNCSLLANTLSCIWVSLPRYVLIENVLEMDSASKDGANACAQAICILVSLGYQVSKKIVSGADVNAASRRERLFIVAAAPGLRLPRDPIVQVTWGPTNAYDAIEDLEPVENDTMLNPMQPDHTPFVRLKVDFDAGIAVRDIVRRVPDVGRRRDLYAAYDLGRLTDAQKKWLKTQTEEKQVSGSRSLRRVDAAGLFPTITCSLIPLNSRGFECIHPFQHRVLTLQEMRRGQGLPDDFLLIGNVNQAVEQIGNGVLWEVGVAWGLAIAEAAYASGVTQRKKQEQERGKRKATNRTEDKREESVEFLEERPAKKARY